MCRQNCGYFERDSGSWSGRRRRICCSRSLAHCHDKQLMCFRHSYYIDVGWKALKVSVKYSFVVIRALLPFLLKGTERTIVNVISELPFSQSISTTHNLS
ncbi:uncharacterized protein N7479_005638 [Penicillium vulpinum]|uniref:uncharacterized protein n=1 Tax=Penicillium vulpinum TaxID=29845 RepID=UPI0025497E34|nr:uncharacterized protein N7479_005638 [Penicillium vulpinum]KAJ5958488.1 hypothetical protein N7479_005638 [Penicillium vulpinum]